MANAVEKFEKAAHDLGLTIEIKTMEESTHTAVEAANAVGCEVGAIVKSLIFEADGKPLLILASGPNRVDTKALGSVLGVKINKADADSVKLSTGYSIGGVPPFGHKEKLRTIVDRDLLNFETVWAAAGTATSVFEIKPELLVEITGGEIRQVNG